ncbi:MAG: hypothetical protein K9J30_08430 [Bacteroidales bacterium]|nr:hypothetical protein [Bacteroidales bacterium]
MRPIALILITTILTLKVNAQETNEEYLGNGTVSGKIFSNFHFSLDNANRKTAFAITRAYFGYEQQLGEYFSANIKLDIGSPDDLSEYSRLRRYAYFKNAGLTYSRNDLTVWAGLFDMLQFKVQERSWGYRYMYRSFLDEYRFGPSADLGLGVRYSFADNLESDIIVSNGEGYTSPQRDNIYKAGWGITYNPLPSITLRGYYSIFLTQVPQMTFTGFAGYRNENFRIGGDFNYQMNFQSNLNRDRYGYSFYSTFVFSEKWEIFLRYDHLYSNIVGATEIPWNLANDGSAAIGGIQFTPVSKVHVTFDYQDWYEYAANGEKEQLLFLHLEVNF